MAGTGFGQSGRIRGRVCWSAEGGLRHQRPARRRQPGRRPRLGLPAPAAHEPRPVSGKTLYRIGFSRETHFRSIPHTHQRSLGGGVANWSTGTFRTGVHGAFGGAHERPTRAAAGRRVGVAGAPAAAGPARLFEPTPAAGALGEAGRLPAVAVSRRRDRVRTARHHRRPPSKPWPWNTCGGDNFYRCFAVVFSSHLRRTSAGVWRWPWSRRWCGCRRWPAAFWCASGWRCAWPTFTTTSTPSSASRPGGAVSSSDAASFSWYARRIFSVAGEEINTSDFTRHRHRHHRPAFCSAFLFSFALNPMITDFD